jgi:pimeloyl-ACP methyl ester carboxylesterase
LEAIMAPTIARDGIKLAYDDRGTGKPALVLVHGWTADRSLFALQAEHFARGRRVVSVDLRGHGESDRPKGPYAIATFADDLAYLTERLELGRTVAVGHSMGGNVVLQLAAAHPDRVAAIVMIDPAPFVFPPELRGALTAMVAAIEAGDQAPRRQFIADHLFLPTTDPKLKANVLELLLAAPSHVAAAAMQGVLGFDNVAAAARCKVPALHVAATAPLNPPQLMSQWLPGVVNGWTVGAGHFCQLEAPEQVNSMIEGFLRHHL